MWHLVHSSWILHVSCNKRRIAPIAALLSSVLHSSLFGDEGMHVMGDTPGPLKWVCVCTCKSFAGFHMMHFLIDVSRNPFFSSSITFLRKAQKVHVQFVLQHFT